MLVAIVARTNERTNIRSRIFSHFVINILLHIKRVIFFFRNFMVVSGISHTLPFSTLLTAQISQTLHAIDKDFVLLINTYYQHSAGL